MKSQFSVIVNVTVQADDEAEAIRLIKEQIVALAVKNYLKHDGYRHPNNERLLPCPPAPDGYRLEILTWEYQGNRPDARGNFDIGVALRTEERLPHNLRLMYEGDSSDLNRAIVHDLNQLPANSLVWWFDEQRRLPESWQSAHDVARQISKEIKQCEVLEYAS